MCILFVGAVYVYSEQRRGEITAAEPQGFEAPMQLTDSFLFSPTNIQFILVYYEEAVNEKTGPDGKVCY